MTWETYHCTKCGRVLLEAYLEGESRIRKRCERCGVWNVIIRPVAPMVPDGQGGLLTAGRAEPIVMVEAR